MCKSESNQQNLSNFKIQSNKDNLTVSTDCLIGVLTYEVKHRKTYDTLCLLKAKGYTNVTVYAQPLHYEKKFIPFIKHRPGLTINMPELSDLCKNLGYKLIKGKISEYEIPSHIPLLICGSGIIPNDFVKNHIIINAHPGYIPVSRGLDAFKWAIWEDKPLGVTTHLIGEFIDAGKVIERREIKLTPYDTFFEAAVRVYENEISMLVESLTHLNKEHTYIEPGENIVHKRMPHKIEIHLLEQFERYKDKNSIIENPTKNI